MSASDALLTAAFIGDIGIAREDTTPPSGIFSRNWGAAAHDAAEGVHRPLNVTAVALSSGDGPPLLLLAVDLGRWRSREDEWCVRGALLDALGIDPSRVLICLSHTHSGPGIYREDAAKPGGHLIAGYLDLLRDRAIRAAGAALQGRKPGRLSWRYGRCDLATNRDRPDGTRFVVGWNPDQPADDTLLVGRIEDPLGGALRGVIVNYACHPTTLAWQNKLISPDYIGAFREVVEGAAGVPCLFLQGASGELAPAEQYTGDTSVADRHGRRLGHAVLGVLDGWPQQSLRYEGVVESGAPLAVFRPAAPAESRDLRAVQRMAELKLKPLATLAEIEAALQACQDRALRERLWRQQGNRKVVGDGATSPTPVWAWRVGEALLVAHPNEAYSQFQVELRRRFSPRPVAVVNLANGGSSGYLPPREHYGRDEYSVWQSSFAEGALETFTAAAAAALGEALGADAKRPRKTEKKTGS